MVPTIGGKYQVIDRLAAGGMAEILTARVVGAKGFEKVVVLKRILPHLAQEEEFVKMFIDEAKICSSLTHGNIAQINDFGEAGGHYFIAMEYVPGQSLSKIIHRARHTHSPMSTEHAAFIAAEALGGLDYAHRAADPATGRPLGIVHRDVSPQNILVSYDGQVKLVDFGIAKAAGKLHATRGGILKGKFGYMAPEQAAGKPIDHRADVFAMGVVLYEMLTGQVLFKGESDLETLRQVQEARLPDLEPLAQRSDAALVRILEKALTRDPNRRFASAGEMQTLLRKFIFERSVETTHLTLGAFVRKLFPDEVQKDRDRRRASSPGTAPALDADEKPTRATPSGSPRPRPGWVVPAVIAGGALLVGAILLVGFALVGRPPADPLPALPPAGAMRIGTRPADATLFIDGRPSANPAEIVGRAPGTRVGVRAVARGHRTLMADVVAGGAPEQTLTLEPLPAFVEIDSTPPGAEAFVGNRSAGKTPLRVPWKLDQTGAIRLVLGEASCEKSVGPSSEWVESGAAAVVKIACVLGKPAASGGRLSIGAVPWAEVYLDGKKLGRRTPIVGHAVEAGEHTVRLVNPATGREKTVQVTVKAGRTATVTANLSGGAP